jgi:hypothetical protein
MAITSVSRFPQGEDVLAIEPFDLLRQRNLGGKANYFCQWQCYFPYVSGKNWVIQLTTQFQNEIDGGRATPVLVGGELAQLLNKPIPQSQARRGTLIAVRTP